MDRVASVVVYFGSSKYNFQARTSVNIILKIADDATEIVHNATRVLEDVQKDWESNISAEFSAKLNSTANKLNHTVDDICYNVLVVDGGNLANPRIVYLLGKVNSNVGSLLPDGTYLCDPFSAPPEYSYQPELCQPSSILIGDIPKVLKPYTCFSDNYEKCGTGQDFISVGEYQVVETYTNSIQSILNMYPSMEYLIQCQLVKDAFSQIILKHCKPMRKFSHMTCTSVVILAGIMVLFVVLWPIKACLDRSYHHSDSSV
ncbi:unnamed protein product [Sphenostylis stenocarpa]|uniref:Uncharacterized protein n=1 Tax=Sphenostylis stenocarpa TaxID=92480 RepID=A0AA86SLJ7_9FABA|nr:unnamed protein product [Sphenostylis stenocarpa]